MNQQGANVCQGNRLYIIQSGDSVSSIAARFGVTSARILELNQLQTDVLSVVFKIADDNELLLIDTKDLKAMLNFVNDNRKVHFCLTKF